MRDEIRDAMYDCKSAVTHHTNTDLEQDEIKAKDVRLSPETHWQRVAAHYGRKAEDHNIAPSADVQYIMDKILIMSQEEAVAILTRAMRYHKDDPNFPSESMEKIKLLVEGQHATGLDAADYDFDVKTEAAVIHYHSPYPEIRSVTEPGDDPSIPMETIRAYFLGLIFMSGCTAVNTFFSPRQPGISISAQFMQLALAPCGFFLARILPDWGVTIRGTRHSLNPGPWSYKEQIFATIIFTISNGPGGVYSLYLVQRLPHFLGYKWVSYPYEITLALATQFFGLGFAGLLRRFVVYPVTAIFPKVLPALALNRALILPDKKDEAVNGWTVSRYRFFMICFGLMFTWFWVPNYLFKALRSFNWMTWTAPENFTLAMITGFWGGMGFNPWATFDWNVAGRTCLVTPFYSLLQQYCARIFSGLIIVAMYWGNMYWSAYMPINSNEAFANDRSIYNLTKVVDETGSSIDMAKYKVYGPPFFSGANVFGQGAWFAWYPMTLFSVTIQHWDSLKNSAGDMYRGVRYRLSIYESYDDPHTRLMRSYPEVPDWWFVCVLFLALGLGIVALKVWPLSTPVWTLFAIAGISAVLLVPSALLMASANVAMGFNVLFQLLAGIWFVGNAEALVIVTAFGQNFNSGAENYISDQKMGHYAKIPPRAVFRGQMLAVLINCFIFVGMLDFMVDHFNHDGTLCQWHNAHHFVCTGAVLVFSSAIEYGAFGVKNMFELYPILPWCFLIGALVGIAWGLGRRYGAAIREYTRKKFALATFASWDKYLFRPLSCLYWFDPPVFWAGTLKWTGGSNLSYATNGMYVSLIFMYYIKRHYGAWWEKYNYLIEAGFGVGVAVSGIIQTFGLAFTGVEFKWWGNTIPYAGVDYQAYNQNASLLPLPDAGYFGPAPGHYPMNFW